MRGLRSDIRMSGLMLWTFFQTPYGIWSGPGAEELEDLERVLCTSSLSSGGTCLKGRRIEGDAGESFGRKKWWRRESLISRGVVALGMEGKRSGGFPIASFFAVQMDRESTVARYCFQWEAFASLIAWKYLFLRFLVSFRWERVGIFLLLREAE